MKENKTLDDVGLIVHVINQRTRLTEKEKDGLTLEVLRFFKLNTSDIAYVRFMSNRWRRTIERLRYKGIMNEK